MNDELDGLWQEADDHVKHGNFGQAIEILKYILIRYGEDRVADERANAQLGDILLTLGRTEKAEIHVRKAISYDPQNPRYRFLMGFIHQTRYEWENAIHEYKSALDRDPNNREYVRALGEAIFESGDKETGIEYLSKAMASSLPNSGILTELATAYLSLGDIERARLCAERAVAIRPDDIMAWAVLQKTHVFGNESSHGTAS
jgi:tetratricopeptide (TPR) repeat protein